MPELAPSVPADPCVTRSREREKSPATGREERLGCAEKRFTSFTIGLSAVYCHTTDVLYR